MDIFLLQIVSAFVLFAVILPLFGIILGVFCYYVLPYLFGWVAMVALAVVAGAQIVLAWWVWLFAFIWASSVHFVRTKLRKLGYEVEHHHAANMMLLAGIPYHRKKNTLPEVCPE